MAEKGHEQVERLSSGYDKTAVTVEIRLDAPIER